MGATKMNKLDRILTGLLSVGIWALTITIATYSMVGFSEEPRSKREIQRIVERCSVSGDIWIPEGEEYGSLDGGYISC